MLQTRVIPCLLLRGLGLVKGVQFKNHKYVGDPINAVRIFNEKEVDELIFLDIMATNKNQDPQFELITDIVSEAFIPFAYGGGLHEIQNIEKIFRLGVEKAVINTEAVTNPSFIRKAADEFGSQSIVVSLDVKYTQRDGYKVFTNSGTVYQPNVDLLNFIEELESLGAGELFINSIDHEGTMNGYPLDLVKLVTKSTSIPVIICGGAGKIDHFKEAIQLGASAVAAGSMFVFHGPHKAVLINYPSQEILTQSVLFNAKD